MDSYSASPVVALQALAASRTLGLQLEQHCSQQLCRSAQKWVPRTLPLGRKGVTSALTPPGKHSSSCSPLNSPAFAVQTVGTQPATQSSGIYANLWQLHGVRKPNFPVGYSIQQKIDLFLCVRHRKLALTVNYKMFLLGLIEQLN